MATHPAPASGRPRPVPCSSHRRDISVQGIQESRLQKQEQPWLLCLLQGPRQLQHEEQQRKGDIYTGSLPGFTHFPTMSSSSFLNTLQICSLQALNWSRLLSLPAGDAPGSIFSKKGQFISRIHFKKERKKKHPPNKLQLEHGHLQQSLLSCWRGAKLPPALLLSLLGRRSWSCA